MILDAVDRFPGYESLHALFPAVTRFLGRPDLGDLAEGRHEIGGTELYAMVIRAAGKSSDDAQLEVHNDYIDIQVVLQGKESIGWKSRSACMTAVADYDPEKDLQFFEDSPDAWVQVHPGQLTVFFPEDAHAPMVSAGFLHKIVIKVAHEKIET